MQLGNFTIKEQCLTNTKNEVSHSDVYQYPSEKTLKFHDLILKKIRDVGKAVSQLENTKKSHKYQIPNETKFAT